MGIAAAPAVRRASATHESLDSSPLVDLLIASLLVLLLVLVGVVWWWVVRPNGRDTPGRDAQLPLFSARTPGSVLRVVGAGPRVARRAVSAAEAPMAAAAVAAAPSPPAARTPVVADREVPIPRSDAPPRVTVARKPQPPELESPRLEASANGANGTTGTNGTNGTNGSNGRHGVAGSSANGPTTADDAKWAPPAEPVPANSTVQFLPGRLDVVHGRGVAGQEVRFVRPTRPGERAVVTFGRGEGPLYRHVQLNVPTVSRLHARLALDEASGDWAVENLSSTNPTVLNDDVLPAGGAPRPLRDGDRLEMGEVVFTFHTQ